MSCERVRLASTGVDIFGERVLTSWVCGCRRCTDTEPLDRVCSSVYEDTLVEVVNGDEGDCIEKSYSVRLHNIDNPKGLD